MSQDIAYQALKELAQLSQKNAKALPAQVDALPRWSGIGFSLLGARFVAPLGQVAEILEVPVSTRLPGVKSWVSGLANVRGRLLPLFNMPEFFGGQATGFRKQHRVLVLDSNNFFCGLIVDQAFGMQHFTSERFSEHAPEVPEAILPIVDGSYTDAMGNTWAVMHLPRLLQDTSFANAALA